MEIFNNILFECLWKKTIEEIIESNHNRDGITEKIILILSSQKLSKQDYKLLEDNSWSILEIEPIMKDASKEELKNYISEYFSEVERIENELKIISPENVAVPCRSKQEEDFDSFLN